MGNGNASGQGTTWWVDVANGHASASATANFASGTRDAALACSNQAHLLGESAGDHPRRRAC